MKIHNCAKHIKSDKKNYVKHGILQKVLKRKKKIEYNNCTKTN